MSRYDINSINTLVRRYKKGKHYNPSDSDTDTCIRIIYTYPTTLFNILSSNRNKPSKYDLNMISALTDILNNKDSIYYMPSYEKDMQIMLQIYKDRKES